MPLTSAKSALAEADSALSEERGRCARCGARVMQEELSVSSRTSHALCAVCLPEEEPFDCLPLKAQRSRVFASADAKNSFLLSQLEEQIHSSEARVEDLERQLIVERPLRRERVATLDNEIKPEDVSDLLWKVPPLCCPICCDVTSFDFESLIEAQTRLTGRLFDCVMMDPPWQLAGSNPTRGVAIGYSQLQDQSIRDLPIGSLCPKGLLFLWTINAKYRLAVQLLECWGFRIVHELSWVKCTSCRHLTKSHGYYLQHCKEVCLVGTKGGFDRCLASCEEVLYAERRGQSQKPTEIYELIERLVPGGYFLEIFGRRNNLRNGWVTLGNEL